VVTDHRIQRVDRSVTEYAGYVADTCPQQRRHLRVGGVLGDRLHRRSGQSGGVEQCRVTPTQRRQ